MTRTLQAAAATPLSQTAEFKLQTPTGDVVRFTNCTVERGLNQAVSLCTLTLPAQRGQLQNQADQPRPTVGEAVALFNDFGNAMLTGYVMNTLAKSRQVTVTVLSRTVQALDHCVSVPGFVLRNQGFASISRSLCAQSETEVVFGPGVNTGEIIGKLQINPGESAVDVIEKLGRKRGYMITDDALGRLVILAQPTGHIAQSLSFPGLADDYSLTDDLRDQYSQVQILGSQRTKKKGDEDATLRVQATASMELPIARTLILQARGETTPAQAKARAGYELKRRAIDAQPLQLSVPALRLVDAGQTANVAIAGEDIGDEKKLVQHTRWSFGDGKGERALITFAPADSFLAEPPEPDQPSANRKSTQITDGFWRDGL